MPENDVEVRGKRVLQGEQKRLAMHGIRGNLAVSNSLRSQGRSVVCTCAVRDRCIRYCTVDERFSHSEYPTPPPATVLSYLIL